MEVPKPGDVVYIETSLYISHGVDDVRGGKATVTRVEDETLGGRGVPFIEVDVDPGSLYNWEHLAAKQAQLAAEFGDRWAYADPDLRPEFNEDGIPTAGPEWEPVAPARTRRGVYLLWLVAILVFVLDRASKAYVLAHASGCLERVVIPGLLNCNYVRNTHGAFGLFGNSPALLIVLALIVLGIFAYAFRDAVQQSNFVRIAFGMITGGAIGNIVDRFQHQWVVDFIDFYRIWPNVFNVADACITVGVALLILAALRRERRAA
ncbi:MAG TPA: signal peptidase II [Candidatus Elarobacter sp.]|jgi:signal peptidase II|nr:signal peptidase II [Candidatus Elarobacter sp.]